MDAKDGSQYDVILATTSCGTSCDVEECRENGTRTCDKAPEHSSTALEGITAVHCKTDVLTSLQHISRRILGEYEAWAGKAVQCEWKCI